MCVLCLILFYYYYSYYSYYYYSAAPRYCFVDLVYESFANVEQNKIANAEAVWA